MWDFHKQGLQMLGDLVMGKVYDDPIAQARYKLKHDGTPRVSAGVTSEKNNFIMQTAIWVVISCHVYGWFTLWWENDAGAYFNECVTMWTMYVYFFQDPDEIDYGH